MLAKGWTQATASNMPCREEDHLFLKSSLCPQVSAFPILLSLLWAPCTQLLQLPQGKESHLNRHWTKWRFLVKSFWNYLWKASRVPSFAVTCYPFSNVIFICQSVVFWISPVHNPATMFVTSENILFRLALTTRASSFWISKGCQLDLSYAHFPHYQSNWQLFLLSPPMPFAPLI